MNNILNLAIKSFNEKENTETYSNLVSEIEQALSSKNEDYINEAIEQAQNNGNHLIIQFIDHIIQNLISNHSFYDELLLKNIYSQLFILPIITQNIDEYTNIPAIHTIENIFN